MHKQKNKKITGKRQNNNDEVLPYVHWRLCLFGLAIQFIVQSLNRVFVMGNSVLPLLDVVAVAGAGC
jgi:lipid-A-disaccharide synthase-like uncharacterized protein